MTDTTVQCVADVRANFASILRTFPEGEREHITGRVWEKNWKPGCGVCAYGYLIERLIDDPDELDGVSCYEIFGVNRMAYDAYCRAYGYVHAGAFLNAKWQVIDVNDQHESYDDPAPKYTMSEVADLLEARNHED